MKIEYTEKEKELMVLRVVGKIASPEEVEWVAQWKQNDEANAEEFEALEYLMYSDAVNAGAEGLDNIKALIRIRKMKDRLGKSILLIIGIAIAVISLWLLV